MPLLALTTLRSALATLLLVAGPSHAALDCPNTFPLPTELQATRLTVVGELHGTEQTPRAVGALVCSKLQSGKRVTLVLEISADEQNRLDAYLASSGGADDRAALLNGAFWSRPLINGRSIQDGRASKAMFGLLDSARQYAQRTRRLTVIAASAYTAKQDPDEMMAAAIRSAMAADPEETVVALMGSVHASGAKGTHWNTEYEGVGYRLRDLKPALVHVSYTGGSAWICTGGTCGEKALFRLPSLLGGPLGFGPPKLEGFTLNLVLGEATASPPAVPP